MPTKRQMLLGLAAGAAGANIPSGGQGTMPTPSPEEQFKLLEYDPMPTPHPELVRPSALDELRFPAATVNIPTDFSTLQEALDALCCRPSCTGKQIILNIEAGHELTAGLVVENGDYSRFKITSTDPEVLLDAAFPTTEPAFKGVNARMPVWGVLVNCNSQVVGSAEEVPAAISVQESSLLNLMAGSGAKNVGATGIFVYKNSRLFSGPGCVFSGCSGYAAWVSQMSDAMLPEADFTNSTHPDAAVFISRACRLSAIGSDFSGATGSGLLVRRSYAVVISNDLPGNTQFHNCGGYAIESHQGSTVVANSRNGVPVSINNCANGILVDGISSVDFSLGELDTVTGAAFTVEDASSLNAPGASALNVGGNVLEISGASKANIQDLTANGATGRAVLASKGSMVAASQANFSNNGGTNAIHAETGAHVDVSGADLSAYAGAGVELNVASGGTISASGAMYSDSNQFANIVTDAGVIFDPAEDSYPLRGSNANGEFIRHADGTQICWIAGVTLSHLNDELLTYEWTFPQAFSSFAIAISVTLGSGDNHTDIDPREVGAPKDASYSLTTRHIGVTRIAGAAVNATATIDSCMLMATGRWF